MVRWQLGGLTNIADTLEVLALRAANAGEAAQAVRLIAVAARIRAAVGTVRPFTRADLPRRSATGSPTPHSATRCSVRSGRQALCSP